MLETMRQQVARRLRDEAGIHPTRLDVADWSEEQCKDATSWMDALLRRKEGHPHAGDTYDFPEHVRVVVRREVSNAVAPVERGFAITQLPVGA